MGIWHDLTNEHGVWTRCRKQYLEGFSQKSMDYNVINMGIHEGVQQRHAGQTKTKKNRNSSWLGDWTEKTWDFRIEIIVNMDIWVRPSTFFEPHPHTASSVGVR